MFILIEGEEKGKLYYSPLRFSVSALASFEVSNRTLSSITFKITCTHLPCNLKPLNLLIGITKIPFYPHFLRKILNLSHVKN